MPFRLSAVGACTLVSIHPTPVIEDAYHGNVWCPRNIFCGPTWLIFGRSSNKDGSRATVTVREPSTVEYTVHSYTYSKYFLHVLYIDRFTAICETNANYSTLMFNIIFIIIGITLV